MKTWITYIAALALGFATALLFKDLEGAFGVFQSVFYFLVNTSIALFIPIVLITFASGVASLRKDSAGSKAGWGVLGWILITNILLPLCAVGVYKLFPVVFPNSSSAGASSDFMQSLISERSLSALSQLYPANPFLLIGYTSTFILPLIVIAWILGFSLKPSADTIRPAYTVMNSFAEVMYRITRTVATIGSAFAYIAATYLFLYLYREKTLFVAGRFSLIMLLGSFAILLFVLPLLYACVTGFRKNPYSIITRSISSLSLGITTGNILVTTLVGESISRQNGGAQKRAISVSSPIFALFGRGGTAFVTTLTILTLMQAVTGEIVSTSVALVIATVVMVTSLASGAFISYEILAMVYLTLNILNIDLYGAEMAIVALLPFLSGLGVMLDSSINNLGNVITSYFIGTDVKVPYSETI